MSKKFLFTDANGDYEESAGAFEVSEHVNSSAGVADAGKPIVLDATGMIDGSMIDDGDIDHGGLAGLADDDHTIYTLADGTRAFTGDQSMGGFQITNLAAGVAPTDAVNLSQLSNAVIGVDYTAGIGGVSKGDLVYVDANDTILPIGIGASEFGIGIAVDDALVSVDTRVLANDTVVTGVLTAATAGDKYYWDGAALTSTIPSGSGAYVWRCGVAKNSTDLHVDVEFIKKNN